MSSKFGLRTGKSMLKILIAGGLNKRGDGVGISREQLNNLFICFSNKETINELMSVKKSCILKYVKRKTYI